VQRENLSKHLSLGIVKRCKDKTSIACEDAAGSKAVVEDNEECIDTIGRETLLNYHLEKEVRWNSVESRNVKTTSVLEERDQLPKPIFQKEFSRGYTNEDHSYKLKTEQRYKNHPQLMEQILVVGGINKIDDDPEYKNFKYELCEEEDNGKSEETGDEDDAFRKSKMDLSSTTNKARGIVQILEIYGFCFGCCLAKDNKRTH
jgi:hypothetical protein